MTRQARSGVRRAFTSGNLYAVRRGHWIAGLSHSSLNTSSLFLGRYPTEEEAKAAHQLAVLAIEGPSGPLPAYEQLSEQTLAAIKGLLIAGSNGCRQSLQLVQDLLSYFASQQAPKG